MSPGVVVTGAGLVTAAGDEVGPLWQRWSAGDTGAIRQVEEFASDDFPSKLAARLDDWDPYATFRRKVLRDTDLVVKAALYAGERAAEQAGLAGRQAGAPPDPERFGVAYGSGFGGVRTNSHWVEHIARDPQGVVSPLAIPMAMHNAGAFHLARRHSAFGPSRTVSTACSSSAAALACAVDALRLGQADAMLVVGADAAAIPGIVRSWRGLRVMNDRNELGGAAYRPFDAERQGFVMGEGAAALVLESAEHARARGAAPIGAVLGYANNLDGRGITAPSVERQARCLRLALADAGLDPGEVAFVAAHGSGTRMNDPVEAQAIREVLGEGALVSEAKPIFGHCMGASGLLEVVLALESLRRRSLPPVPNLSQLDEACPVRVPPPGGAELPAGAALVNSFGFGGTNVTVALGAAPA